MKNTVTFTSAISPEMITILNEYSKKLNIPKSQFISLAIKNYITELKKQEYIQSFKKVKNDSEIISLTNDGIDDFLELISK
jgi:predicted DNA-binding protein